MGAKYWIKLYHEILHDPKMARMDSELWRRTIELFLLAGETGDDGSLPCLEDMAWTLRANTEQLEIELIELQKVGIVSVVGSRYFVTKFAERQKPMTKAEYMQRKRDEEQRQEYYQPVTKRYQSVTNGNAEPEENREDKNKNRAYPDDATESLKVFSTVTGMMTFPSSSIDRDIERVGIIVRQRGVDDAINYLKDFYAAWVVRKRKDGKIYSKLNTTWLDWAIAGEIPEPYNPNGQDESWKIGYSTSD